MRSNAVSDRPGGRGGILILGIGNCLMTDDGIGVHAARMLAQNPPCGCTVIDAGTDFMSVAPFLEQHSHVLVIDALDGGGPPGTLYEYPLSAIDQPGPGCSLHEMNLLAILEFVDPKKRPRIHFLGVQPARIELGLALTPLLAGLLPVVVNKAVELVASWDVSSGA